MKNTGNSSVSVIIAVTACLIVVITAFYSMSSIKDYKSKSDEDFQKVFSTLTKISDRLNIISNKLYSSKPKFIVKQSNLPVESGDQTKDWLNLLDGDLQKMETMLTKTGLEQLATNKDVSSAMLGEMVEQYAEEKKQDDFRQTLTQMNTDFHTSDKEKYDEKLTELYDKARSRGRNRNNKESEEAFNSMLKDYPDSYSTGMLIAERAIRASFRNNVGDMEKYYNMLAENDSFNNIVIDWGIEAQPALQYNLANRYIDEKRYDDAQKMIEQLEQYGGNDGYVFVPSGRRRRGGTSLKPISDAVSTLNSKLINR